MFKSARGQYRAGSLLRSAHDEVRVDILTVASGHGASTDPIQSELNRRGAEGWELVAMTRDENPADDHDEEVAMFVSERAKS